MIVFFAIMSVYTITLVRLRKLAIGILVQGVNVASTLQFVVPCHISITVMGTA